MAVVINSGSSGELNPTFDGSQAPVATAIAVVRTTGLSVTLDGTAVDALSAQAEYGWDKVSGQATVVLPALQGADIGQSVVITMNAIVRFRGTVRQLDSTLAPHAVGLLCKDPLYALEEYENGTETVEADEGKPGLAFEDLVGVSGTATLRQIVTAVLDRVGVSYTLANLDNPSHVYGTDAPEEFTWGTHESAADYLNRILAASEGYRLFASADGNVYLRQVIATPSLSPDFTFTLGADIFGDSNASTSSIGQKAAVLVEGYDDGSGPASSGIIGAGTSVFRVSSPLIETDAWATTLANFWLPQVNRRQQQITLVTPRTELFGAGQTHYIDAAGGLSVSSTMYVKSTGCQVAPDGQFTQRNVYTVGAAS